jgi:hypothetical protein
MSELHNIILYKKNKNYSRTESGDFKPLHFAYNEFEEVLQQFPNTK